jgi:hypothetical protein
MRKFVWSKAKKRQTSIALSTTTCVCGFDENQFKQNIFVMFLEKETFLTCVKCINYFSKTLVKDRKNDVYKSVKFIKFVLGYVNHVMH